MDSISGDKPLPGSQLLRNFRHERFAQARAVLRPLLEAARYAGYETMTPGNAAKIDRSRLVQARIKFLAGNSEETIRRKRESVERELNLIAMSNMDDFISFNENGLPSLDLNRVRALPDVERRELMAAVKTVRHTENGPTFELHPKLEALAQLRKINGLDAPDKTAFTDADGNPLKVVHEVSWKNSSPPSDAASQPSGSL